MLLFAVRGAGPSLGGDRTDEATVRRGEETGLTASTTAGLRREQDDPRTERG